VINKALVAALALAVSFTSNAADSAEIKILCASGMREVVNELQPQLVQVTGQQVSISVGEAGDLRKRIQGGEVADVAVLPRMTLDRVLAEGKIVPGTIIDVAQSSMGIGVRKDSPKPDIGSADKFKQALLAAKTIVITDPASGGAAGVYIDEVFRRLGIIDQLTPKLKLTRGQRNAEFVARGEADIAVQLSNEIRIVPGVEFIPLPPEFERTIVFSAGLGSNAREPSAAKMILQFLSGPETLAVIQAKGMDRVIQVNVTVTACRLLNVRFVVGSIGRCNTSIKSRSARVSKPKVSRDRSLSCRATRLNCECAPPAVPQLLLGHRVEPSNISSTHRPSTPSLASEIKCCVTRKGSSMSNVVELRQLPSEPCPRCGFPMQAGRTETTPTVITHWYCCTNAKCPISDAAVSTPRHMLQSSAH